MTGHGFGMDLLIAEGTSSSKLLAQWLVQIQTHIRKVTNVHDHFRSGHNRDHQSLMHVKSCANTFVDVCT